MASKVKPLTEKHKQEHADDRARMVQLLMQHEHDQAGFTRYGNYDVFQRFMLEEMRTPQIITDVLDIQPQTSRVPVLKVSSLGCVRILLGKKHISDIAQILQDPHVARQLDLAGDQAIHPDTYRNLLEYAGFNERARQEIQHRQIKVMRAAGHLAMDDDGLYGADTSYIEVPPEFDVPEVYNYRTKKAGKYLKVGFLVKIKQRESHLIIAVTVALGNVDDRDILKTLLDEANLFLDRDAIRILLLDRGFYDGACLHELKFQRQIDFIIPPENICDYVREAKEETAHYQPVERNGRTYRIAILENLQDVPGYTGTLNLVLDDRRSEAQRQATKTAKEVTGSAKGSEMPPPLASLSARQLRAIVQQGKEEIRKEYQVRLARLKRPSKIAEVRAEREARLKPLNTAGIKKATLVTTILSHLQETKAFRLAQQMQQPARKPKARLKAGEKQIHSYLTCLPVKEGVDIILTYHQRIEIDNSVIKMLKTYLVLEGWPSHNLEAVKNHVLLVCLVFNMIQLFRNKRGRAFAAQSIAKLQQEFLGQLAIAIYAGQEYDILTFEEFVQTVAQSAGIRLQPPARPPGSF
jgi:hypothetical protein